MPFGNLSYLTAYKMHGCQFNFKPSHIILVNWTLCDIGTEF